MDGQTVETTETSQEQSFTDPWEAAFAAVNKEATQAAKEDSIPEGKEPEATEGTDATPDASSDGLGSGDNVQDEPGGSHLFDGGDTSEDGLLDSGNEGSFDVDVEEVRQLVVQELEEQAINTVAQDFIRRGARHTNGRLGASINDPDIMKRDEDGVPHFYNPETGREFNGDNPRRQALEWCDDYNRELANLFNQECQRVVNENIGNTEAQLQVLEFGKTYDALDPIRQQMLDSMLEDYEIKDSNGRAIGYSIDPNKALQAVNRQVQKIQEYSKAQGVSAPVPKTNDGPALDMKNSANSGGKSEADFKPKNLAEAMEYLQKQEMEKLNKKGK